MSAYIVAGYVVALSTLAFYSATLIVRVRAARRRLRAIAIDERAKDARAGGAGAAADEP